MRKLYIILAVVGWVWLVIVAVFMALRQSFGKRLNRPGFTVQNASTEVEESHE